LLAAAPSCAPKSLFSSQSRKSAFHSPIAMRSAAVQPGAPVARTAWASRTLVYDCEKSMMPMARPSYLHGMNWAWSRFGFIRVAGSRNQVRRIRPAFSA